MYNFYAFFAFNKKYEYFLLTDANTRLIRVIIRWHVLMLNNTTTLRLALFLKIEGNKKRFVC